MTVHPMHEAENKNYMVFRKSSHTYFCQLSCTFQFLSSQLCGNNQKEKKKTNKPLTSPPQCKANKDSKCHTG